MKNRKVSWYHHIYHSLSCMGRSTLISVNLTYLEKLSLGTQFIFSWKQTTLFYLTFKEALKCNISITPFKSWGWWFLSSFDIHFFPPPFCFLGLGKVDSQNQQHKSTLYFFNVSDQYPIFWGFLQLFFFNFFEQKSRSWKINVRHAC